MQMYDTNSGSTKMLQVSHGLAAQSAVAGEGRGSYKVVSGFPQIHTAVLEMLKLDIVWHVICADGYFIITVSEPHRWKEVEGELHHIVANHTEVTT